MNKILYACICKALYAAKTLLFYFYPQQNGLYILFFCLYSPINRYLTRGIFKGVTVKKQYKINGVD